MKKYGIYLAYPPTVDLRSEGLGRHMAEFLKAAQARGDIRFVISCPSWMRTNLTELFDASGIRSDSFEFLSPGNKPLVLEVYERYLAFKKRRKRTSLFRCAAMAWRDGYNDLLNLAERKIVTARNLAYCVALGVLALPVVLLLGLLALLTMACLVPLQHWFRRHSPGQRIRTKIQNVSNRLKLLIRRPKEDAEALRWYSLMLEGEISLMRDMINARTDIAAWYCPTAFWPHFHNIKAPRLMCVPDVVLADFPVGFAPVGGDRFLQSFREVERSIFAGEYFLTYSEEIKWRTLVDRYHIDPSFVHVVPHGANQLDELVVVSGSSDDDSRTNALCRKFFRSALSKAMGPVDAHLFGGEDVRFLFYASQIRPNKNLISLLQAYEYLLRRRHIGYKLVLTGNPNVIPEVQTFIAQHNLTDDVLFLHGLSAQELAACYRLADLAVNPSLSEGGCPFTFCEALSVGTPVVMARIPVTEEVITDPDLQALMFFDPYDWLDMAGRIEWALQNLNILHANQAPFYAKLAQRTWRNVVDEHVEILDRISSPANKTDSNRPPDLPTQTGYGQESVHAKY